MRFEDILPAVKSGRLARRKSWEEGNCIGASLNAMRSGTATDIVKFYGYDRDGHSCSYYGSRIDLDLVANDWELVPEVPSNVDIPYQLKATLNALALSLQNTGEFDPTCAPRAFVISALEAYKNGKPEDILKTITLGVTWLAALKPTSS